MDSKGKDQSSKIRLPSISLLAQSLPPLNSVPSNFEPQQRATKTSETSILSKSPFEDVPSHRSSVIVPTSTTSPQPEYQEQPIHHSPPAIFHFKGDFTNNAQFTSPHRISRDEYQRHLAMHQQAQPVPVQYPPGVFYTDQLPTSFPNQFPPSGRYLMKSRRTSKTNDRKVKPRLHCHRCGITDTPEWRKGPNGARTLCNACGLYHAKILKREGPEAAAAAVLNGEKIVKKTFQRRPSYIVPEYIPPKQEFETNYQFNSNSIHLVQNGYFEPIQHAGYAYTRESLSYPPHLKVPQQVSYHNTQDPTSAPNNYISPILDRESGK